MQITTVMPAEAGIHASAPWLAIPLCLDPELAWIPAFAGMTLVGGERPGNQHRHADRLCAGGVGVPVAAVEALCTSVAAQAARGPAGCQPVAISCAIPPL